jgi:hypothetical protein
MQPLPSLFLCTVVLGMTVSSPGLAGSHHKVAPEDENIVLQGKAVNSVTGAPVRAALVQLVGENPRAVMTAADGSFEFEGLATGDAVISVRKPGYFSAQEYYPESVGEQHVHLVPHLQAIELKLYPEAVVYGRVTNENGRPLEGFTIQLTHLGTRNSARARADRPTVTTNENGEYRISELHAGRYLISVTQTMDAHSSLALFQASKFLTGYPRYFYPSVTDPGLATPVKLTSGKQVQADLRLTSQPLYRIAGDVQGGSREAPIVVVVVGQHDTNPVAATSIMPGLTHFELAGVPGGSYFLGAIQLGARDGSREKSVIRMLPSITRDVDDVSIALSEKKTVQVRFHYQFAHPSGNPAEGLGETVSILRTDLPIEMDLFSATLLPNPDNPNAGNRIELDTGSYRARVNPHASRCVASVKSGAMDILAEDLVVTADGAVEPIEVVLRDDCARIQGTVLKGGQPAMGRVFMIPEEAPQRAVSSAANSDGGFQFEGLVPGRYVAAALEGADDLDPDDPETATKVRSLGTSVELAASGAANLTIELKSLEP